MFMLSFLAGLPPFWILKKSQQSLPYLVTLTSGMLLSTCINIVLPETLSNLNSDALKSSSLGPQILLGFLLLYCVDAFSNMFSNYFVGETSIDDDGMNDIALDLDIENQNQNEFSIGNIARNFNFGTIKNLILSVVSNSTTLGLILHCLTDGIILTTSLLSEALNSNNNDTNNNNAFLIILAIFLHKLPASFSLTSILLNQNLPKQYVLFHLLLFSVSAPIGAWLTYFLSKIFKLNENSNSFIMLFSTGAFLYVSFHTFVSCHSHDSISVNKADNQFKQNWNFMVMVLGLLIPLLVALLHDE